MSDSPRDTRIVYAMFVAAIVLVAVVVGFAAYNAGYSAGMEYMAKKYGANIRSGTPLEIEDRPQLIADSDIVKRCISRCNSVKSIGVPIQNGSCIVAQPAELNGFVCAVVVNDGGHCPAYDLGKSPEIVLNPACEFVGVYSPKGGE